MTMSQRFEVRHVGNAHEVVHGETGTVLAAFAENGYFNAKTEADTLLEEIQTVVDLGRRARQSDSERVARALDEYLVDKAIAPALRKAYQRLTEEFNKSQWTPPPADVDKLGDGLHSDDNTAAAVPRFRAEQAVHLALSCCDSATGVCDGEDVKEIFENAGIKGPMVLRD